MSLSADSVDDKRVKIVLRSADQYLLWKARCAAACWSVAKQNIFEVTDEECDTASEESKKDPRPTDWVGKCWLIITLALHDELFMKVAHVEQPYCLTLRRDPCISSCQLLRRHSATPHRDLLRYHGKQRQRPANVYLLSHFS